MADKPAGIALARGFKTSAASEANLWIWVFGKDRYRQLRKAVEWNLIKRIVGSIDLKLTWFGSGIDFKKLFGLDQ